MLTRLQKRLQLQKESTNHEYNHPVDDLYTDDCYKRKPIPLNIDFDAASKAWKRNKIYLGNGVYEYKTLRNQSKKN